jgi:hypothetical protein
MEEPTGGMPPTGPCVLLVSSAYMTPQVVKSILLCALDIAFAFVQSSSWNLARDKTTGQAYDELAR